MQFSYQTQGEFAKPNEDIFDGDIITLLDSGNMREGDYKGKPTKQWVFKVSIKGKEKLIRMNGKSQNNMVRAYPDGPEDDKENCNKSDSCKWVGEEIKVWIVKALIASEMRNVVYYSHPEAKMDDKGNFSLDSEFVKVEKPEDATSV